MKSKRNKGIVYLWDKKAGLLERTESGYRFTYYQEYLSEKNAQPVSLTLPLREEPYEGESEPAASPRDCQVARPSPRSRDDNS